MNINDFIRRKTYEDKLYIIRQHPVAFVPTILLFIGLALVPIGIYFLTAAVFPTILSGQIGWTLLILFISVYLLSILLFFYSYFVTFYLDVTIITNDRMLDVEQHSLFGRTVSEVDLYQIQDAISVMNGFFRTIFGYGDVVIQTAGSVPRFTLHRVPHPHQLRQMLLDFASADKQFHNKR